MRKSEFVVPTLSSGMSDLGRGQSRHDPTSIRVAGLTCAMPTAIYGLNGLTLSPRGNTLKVRILYIQVAELSLWCDRLFQLLPFEILQL